MAPDQERKKKKNNNLVNRSRVNISIKYLFWHHNRELRALIIIYNILNILFLSAFHHHDKCGVCAFARGLWNASKVISIISVISLLPGKKKITRKPTAKKKRQHTNKMGILNVKCVFLESFSIFLFGSLIHRNVVSHYIFVCLHALCATCVLIAK